MNTNEILDVMKEYFPNAKCELIHHNAYELLVAVVLSAQTTDASVNKVTPALFAAYPDAFALAKGDIKDIEAKLRYLGLYRNKAKSLSSLGKDLVERFNGEVPSSMKELTSLAGVGRKTANVVRAVWFNIPSMPVDTHVNRIAKRLGLAKVNDDLMTVERKLKRKINRERWNEAHHLFIFFGRYHCMAKNPKCNDCLLKDKCKIEKLK